MKYEPELKYVNKFIQNEICIQIEITQVDKKTA